MYVIFISTSASLSSLAMPASSPASPRPCSHGCLPQFLELLFLMSVSEADQSPISGSLNSSYFRDKQSWNSENRPLCSIPPVPAMSNNKRPLCSFGAHCGHQFATSYQFPKPPSKICSYFMLHTESHPQVNLATAQPFGKQRN